MNKKYKSDFIKKLEDIKVRGKSDLYNKVYVSMSAIQQGALKGDIKNGTFQIRDINFTQNLKIKFCFYNNELYFWDILNYDI